MLYASNVFASGKTEVKYRSPLMTLTPPTLRPAFIMYKMLTTKIAEPYASALFNLAVSTQTVDIITSDVNKLVQIFTENKELTDYLTNPLYPQRSKKDVLNRIIEPLGLNNNTIRFLLILVERSRISIFQSIGEKFLLSVFELAEIKIAKVTSSVALQPEQEIQIIENLKIRTGAKEIKLLVDTDKNLLGGLQVQIGSDIIDTSLKGQLRQLAAQLETTLF